MMNVLDGPINTFNYMVLGYGVILGCMAIFAASLAFRFRNLRRELEVYRTMEMEEDEESKP
jgi:hypothetical protein